jgi:hypothetical protein
MARYTSYVPVRLRPSERELIEHPARRVADVSRSELLRRAAVARATHPNRCQREHA